MQSRKRLQQALSQNTEQQIVKDMVAVGIGIGFAAFAKF
jgi:hypothetical protein